MTAFMMQYSFDVSQNTLVEKEEYRYQGLHLITPITHQGWICGTNNNL